MSEPVGPGRRPGLAGQADHSGGGARPVARRPGDGGPTLAEPPCRNGQVPGADVGAIDWRFMRFLVPLDQRSAILALGSGVSSRARALAEACRMVIVMGRGSAGVGSVEAGRAEHGVGAVHPLCGSLAGPFPLHDGCLDLVILDQVPDPMWSRDGGGRMEIQRGVLEEAWRTLRAGGAFCLVVGRGVDGRAPRRTRKLLERCGFSECEFYWPYPSYSRHTALAPLTTGRVMRSCVDIFVEGNAFRERRKRAWLKGLATIGLLRYLLSEYIVVARKGS